MYYQDKQSKGWVKMKYMQEEDFIAAGYIYKEGSGVSIVLGNQADGKLQYQGHITQEVTCAKVKEIDTNPHCPFEQLPPGNDGAIWFDYIPLCN